VEDAPNNWEFLEKWSFLDIAGDPKSFEHGNANFTNLTNQNITVVI
jgi:hypothetical protein